MTLRSLWEPAAERVLLRIEYSDGQIREFEAQKPHALEITVRTPDPSFPFPSGSPLMITGGDFTSVTLGFDVSRDPRYPMSIRTEANPAVTP